MPRAPSAQRVPHSLEAIFGRESICAHAIELFRAGSRIVTLVGPGGIGKTRVARDVARYISQQFAEGVFVCDLAGLRTDSEIEGPMARALGFAEGARKKRTANGSSLVDKLSGRGEMLVLLDNIDPVVQPVATFVKRCVERAANIRFLLTSREQLRIEGERVVAIGPLSTEAGVAMFRSHTPKGEATAAANDGNSEEDLRALVERLDGIPLAIELAARRADVVSPREFVERLEERFRLLKSDRRDIDPRHAALVTTLEWSWCMLADDEKTALAAVSVFPREFSVEAFEAIVGPLLGTDAIDVAEQLVRKSLITTTGTRGAARIQLLETVHAFAKEKWTQNKTRADAESRHARYFLARAEEAAARAYGPFADDALDALESDLANLFLVFAREKTRSSDTPARMAAAMADLVLFRDVVDLRSPFFDEAQSSADGHACPELRARVRILHARVLLELMEPVRAIALLEEAMTIAKKARLAKVEADAVRSLGWAQLAAGNAAKAREAIEEALTVYEGGSRDGDPEVRGHADALALRGLLNSLEGQPDRGIRDFEAAYALHVASGETLRRAKVVEMARVVGCDLNDPEDDSISASARAQKLRMLAAAHHATGKVWREALVLARAEALEHSSGTPSKSPEIETTEPRTAWSIGPDARWFAAPGVTPTDLSRHGALRRVLDALTAARIERPGQPLSAYELFETAWPDESARHESAMLRVYTTIRRLRKTGLSEVLLTRDEGYLFDPAVSFVRTTS